MAEKSMVVASLWNLLRGCRVDPVVREYIGRGPPPGSGSCFNCGLDGHWARDCKAGDWKNKCYRCGERGHIERNCKNSPKKLRRSRSLSRSPLRSRSPRRRRGRSRSFSRSRSYSRSRSPPMKVRVDRDPRRPDDSRSPEPRQDSAPPKSRKRSLTPGDGNARHRDSISPENVRVLMGRNGDSQSPRERSKSPGSNEKGGQAARRYEDSLYEVNGRNSHSPSPRHERSPADDVDEQYAPRGSESP